MFRRIIAVIMTVFMLAAFPAAFAEKHSETLFDFELPAGFYIPDDQLNNDECFIVCREIGPVGGMILTDFDELILVDYDGEEIRDYLQKFVPSGYGLDYMISWSDCVEASMNLVNLSTLESVEFKHYFFEKDGKIIDCWLNTMYLDGKDQIAFCQAFGINQNVIYVPNSTEVEPTFDFALPEGYTLAEEENDACAILLNGQTVGGIEYTGIQPEVFCETERRNFWDQMTEEWGYLDVSKSDFSMIRFLTQSLPEECWAEYMIMYWNEEEEQPVAGISFAVTNEATGERQDTSHTFFCKDGAVYDIWVDRALEEDGSMPLYAALGI